MLEFIQLLCQRYRAVSQQPGNEAMKPAYQRRIDQLILAEAYLRKGQLIATVTELPLQIAVVGPTQSGKSTLVNLLSESDRAGISPLAGYTIHPQGFCLGVTLEQCRGLQRYFGRFQQLQPSQLSRERHDCYALSEISSTSSRLPSCVIWDTPDFDSIDSTTYREGVIRTVALADIVILVVSKEKYADQSVWDVMSALEALHQPMLIVLNKLAEGSEAMIIHSLKEKWQMTRTDDFPEVIPLFYEKQSGLPSWPASASDHLKRLAARVNPKKHERHEHDLLQNYWSSWLEPVVDEHESLSQWHAGVEQVLNRALTDYQRDFLNHPHHYETFQCALAELLTLLEIPGLAGILAGTRKVLTWPVRQLMKIGQKRTNFSDSSHEVELLNQIAEHSLIQLADFLIEKSEDNKHRAWWKELSTQLRGRRQAILLNFDQAAKAYHQAFRPEIEMAANRLYQNMQEQPILLNSLRATRVTIDAAMIASTLIYGGIGIHDLVIAPSMLAFTSLLFENGFGMYIDREKTKLKQEQLSRVRNHLYGTQFRNDILALTEQLSASNHFNISPEQVRTAEAYFKDKRHGLRLL